MQKKKLGKVLETLLLIVSLSIIGSAGEGYGADPPTPPPFDKMMDLSYESFEIGDMIVYFHQRMIDDAYVEGDYVVYQFDKDSGRLLKEIINWREDLPEELPASLSSPEMIEESRKSAESLFDKDKEEVFFSRLVFISPISDIHRLEIETDNPCWVVRTEKIRGTRAITIIDAIDNLIVGQGEPPPFTAFSMRGPHSEKPCTYGWWSLQQSATTWFDAMGYNTEAVDWPTKAKIQSHIQSTETAMFYEVGHSQYTLGLLFTSGCDGDGSYEVTTAVEVQNWISGYTKMPFTFIASCFGMCDTGPGTLSHAFRKGSLLKTTTVGYCNMSEPECTSCWWYAESWQNELFNYMNLGWTVKAAFDQAVADLPSCLDCMRFEGDESFAVVPVVNRGVNLEGLLDDLLRQFREFRRVFPPDPVIKRFLDKAEVELEKALGEALLGKVQGIFDSLHKVIRFVEKAGKRGKVDTSEFNRALTETAGRQVEAEIRDAQSKVGSQNIRIRNAWQKYALATSKLNSGNYKAAIKQFKNAYFQIMKLNRNL